MTEQLQLLEERLRRAESRRDLVRRWLGDAEAEAARLRTALAFNMPAWAFDLINEWVAEARSNLSLREREVFHASDAITKAMREAGDITQPGSQHDPQLTALLCNLRDARKRVNGDALSHAAVREARMALEDYLTETDE